MQAIKDFLTSQMGNDSPDWQQQGSGLLTWSVFSIYRATLWTAGSLELHENQPGNNAFALQFEYLRNVSADYIIDASQREMLRIASATDTAIAQWTDQLRTIIPDAGRGDLLWILFLPEQQEVRFYNDEQLLGSMVSSGFPRAFADIWFHQQCHSPRLRNQLLGEA